MNLVFYPANFNLSYLHKHADKLISNFKILNETYKIFAYDKYNVIEVKNNFIETSNSKNLNFLLDYIKNLTQQNKEIKYNIHIITDGYSESFKEIDISKYITYNINSINYYVDENRYYCGILDFSDKWLSYDKFFYMKL